MFQFLVWVAISVVAFSTALAALLPSQPELVLALIIFLPALAIVFYVLVKARAGRKAGGAN
jgi:hypothetical protein